MLNGKKVLVLGLAKSGQAAVELLTALHATITVNEYASREKIACYDEYVHRGIEMITGGHPQELFERDFDFVVKNPGINYHKPFVLRLKERGIPVYTEIELAYQVAKMQNYIAITGTNGKTTTVTLIDEILKHAHHLSCLAGNVGIPYSSCVLDNDLLHCDGYDVVLEMSNFQLLDIEKFHPHISTIINLTPDHLDYMASLDEYYASKTRIYMNQDKQDYFIENLDDEILQSYLRKYPVLAQRVTFSLTKPADCMIQNQAIYYKGNHVIDLDEIKIVGDHNIQNKKFFNIMLDEFSSCSNPTDYKNQSHNYFSDNKLYVTRCSGGIVLEYTLDGTNTQKKDLSNIVNLQNATVKEVKDGYVFFEGKDSSRNTKIVKCSQKSYECETVENEN